MVSEINRRGLIVTPARRTSDLVEQLVAHFHWPVLHAPTIRLLVQQIEVHAPHCLLFWLDETHDISESLRLITRLRGRGPRPYRIAVAHQLRAEDEPKIRAAGVHSFLFTSGNIAALVEESLMPLMNVQSQPATSDHESFNHTEPAIRGPTAARASPAKTHPP
jgi:hypothetical protein